MNKMFGFCMSLLILLASIGCDSGPPIATVQGTVTLDGKPLEGAVVNFAPEAGGRPAGGTTDAAGKYVLNFSEGRNGAIPGKNNVQISTRADPYMDVDNKPVKGRPEMVPMEYNSQSKLTFNVEDGKTNIADFDLKSGGKVDRAQPGY